MSRLTGLRLWNWKSFGDDDDNLIRLAPTTLLVGPNGVGKSNFLDALRFIQGSALDFPLGDVLRGRHEGQRAVWPGIRGGIAEAARVGTDVFSIQSNWGLDDLGAVSHSLAVATATDPGLVEERCDELGSDRSPLFDSTSRSLGMGALRVDSGSIRAAFRATGAGKSGSATYAAHRLILGQLHPLPRMHPDVLTVSHAVRESMRTLTFLDIQPTLMRDYRPMGAGALGTSGENISPVLRELGAAGRNDVVDWLSELCAPEVVGIDFDETKLREVMLLLVEEGGRRVSARSASDGTLRFLGLIAALLTVPEGTVLVMEEPDVGLHPSRIRLLAELFDSLARERHLQIIATTHSPTLLAHLSAETFGDVIAFARNAAGLTVAKRLDDLEHFETLRESEHLEELISSGWIERAM